MVMLFLVYLPYQIGQTLVIYNCNEKMKRTVFHTSKTFLTQAFSQPDTLFPFLGSKVVDNYAKSIIKFQKIYGVCNMANINDVVPLPPPTKQFIFFGRSNVGKSSLMNKLMQCDVAAVSKRPGKTKQLMFCEVGSNKLSDSKMIGSRIYFVDAPGYGYATGVSKDEIKKWGKLITTYLKRTKQNSENQKVLCLLDITHDLKQTDCLVFELLQSVGKHFQIIFTKCDKFSLNQSADDVKKALDIVSLIQNKYQQHANFYSHFTSCRTGLGIDELRNHIIFQIVSNKF